MKYNQNDQTFFFLRDPWRGSLKTVCVLPDTVFKEDDTGIIMYVSFSLCESFKGNQSSQVSLVSQGKQVY